MPDIFLRQGEPNPNDIVLRDPTFVTSDQSLAAGNQSITASAPLVTLLVGAIALLAGVTTVTASAPTAAVAATVSLAAGQASTTISAPAPTLVAVVSLAAGNQSVTVSAPTASLVLQLTAGAVTVQVSAPTATRSTAVSLRYDGFDREILLAANIYDTDLTEVAPEDSPLAISAAFMAGVLSGDPNDRYFWDFGIIGASEPTSFIHVAISLRDYWNTVVKPMFPHINDAPWPPFTIRLKLGQDETTNTFYVIPDDFAIDFVFFRNNPNGPNGSLAIDAQVATYPSPNEETYTVSWGGTLGISADDYPVIGIRGEDFLPAPEHDFFEIYFDPFQTGFEPENRSTLHLAFAMDPICPTVYVRAPTAVLNTGSPQSLAAGTPNVQISAPTATLVADVQLQTTLKFWILSPFLGNEFDPQVAGTTAKVRMALDLQNPVDEGFEVFLGEQPIFFISDYIVDGKVVRADETFPTPWPTAFWRLYLRYEFIESADNWIAPAIHLLRVGENNEIIEEHDLPIDSLTDFELRASGFITWSVPTGADADRIAISIIADPDFSVATLLKVNEADPNWLETDLIDRHIEFSAPAVTLDATTALAAGNQSVTLSAPTATVTVSAVSVAAGLSSVEASAPSATLTTGGVALLAGAATISLVAPDVTLDAPTGDQTLGAGLSSVMASAPAVTLVPGDVTFDIPDNAPVISVSAPDADVALPLSAGGNTVQVIAPIATIEQGEPPEDVVGPPLYYPTYPAFKQEEAEYAGVAAMRFGFEDRVNRAQVSATGAHLTAAPRGLAQTERVTVPVMSLTAAPGGDLQQERSTAALAAVRVVPSGLAAQEAHPDPVPVTLRAINESGAISGSRRAALLADDDDLLLITEVL